MTDLRVLYPTPNGLQRDGKVVASEKNDLCVSCIFQQRTVNNGAFGQRALPVRMLDRAAWIVYASSMDAYVWDAQ